MYIYKYTCGLYVCVYEDDIDKHGYTYKLDRYGYYTYFRANHLLLDNQIGNSLLEKAILSHFLIATSSLNEVEAHEIFSFVISMSIGVFIVCFLFRQPC